LCEHREKETRGFHSLLPNKSFQPTKPTLNVSAIHQRPGGSLKFEGNGNKSDFIPSANTKNISFERLDYLTGFLQ